MKNPISLLLAFAFFTGFGSQTHAQQWLAEGQVWTYEVYGGWLPGNYGLHTLQVEGDTVIQGVPCKILTHYPIVTDPIEYVAYAQNDSVMVYNHSHDAFEKIYDFNLSVGDTLKSINFRYVVDSVGIIHISGRDFRFQRVDFPSASPWFDHTWILEGMGFIGDPFNDRTNLCSYFLLNYFYCAAAVDGWDARFRCFSDDDFIYDPFHTCVLATAESTPRFDVFPNPATDHLSIKIEGTAHPRKVQLYDARGVEVWSAPFTDGDFDLAGLSPGMYFLKLVWRDQRTSVRKIILIP